MMEIVFSARRCEVNQRSSRVRPVCVRAGLASVQEPVAFCFFWVARKGFH
jgi:hypothetical protein